MSFILRALPNGFLVRALCIGSFSCLPQLAAQDTVQAQSDPAPAASPREIRSAAVSASAEQFQLFLNADAEQPLEMKRVFQWGDPLLPESRSLCLLYLHEGRPVASCKVYYGTRRAIVHNFISMSDEPLVARSDDQVVWTPPESGLEFQQLVGVRPDDNPGRRRIQMKAIAREFSAVTGDGEAKRQQGIRDLRLLPTPLYRYPDDLKSDEGAFDGAVFVFVVGRGNPQFLLTLEAVREQGRTHWQYAFSRRTFAKLEVFHKDQAVWDVPFFPQRQMTSFANFCKIYVPLKDR